MTEASATASGSEDVLSNLRGILAQMGAVLLSAETVETVVELITRLATIALPGSLGAGVTLVNDRGMRSMAALDPLVEAADSLQYELNSGPCLTAWRERTVVCIDDVKQDDRWPEWSAAVAELDVASVLSAPLLVGAECIGAIKVYAREPSVYDDQAVSMVQLFAQQAAILLVNTQAVAETRQLSAQLTESLRNRDLVSQAKGILLTRGAANDQEAFAMLVAVAGRSNLTVHEVAGQVVASVIDPPTG